VSHEPTITFRLLSVDDLPTLYEWLGRPHVAAWWGPVESLAELVREYAPRTIPGAREQAYFAYVDETPIGFIQSYVVKDAGDGWWPDETDPGARGIDQFLADGDRLGQGLGTAMVRTFVARLFADPAVTVVQTDPDPTNGRAVRCYEKAGFRAVGEIDTRDGRALLMRCERP
jgi:RimJ/RimL family protein N-acetyltransferase